MIEGAWQNGWESTEWTRVCGATVWAARRASPSPGAWIVCGDMSGDIANLRSDVGDMISLIDGLFSVAVRTLFQTNPISDTRDFFRVACGATSHVAARAEKLARMDVAAAHSLV